MAGFHETELGVPAGDLTCFKAPVMAHLHVSSGEVRWKSKNQPNSCLCLRGFSEHEHRRVQEDPGLSADQSAPKTPPGMCCCWVEPESDRSF